MVLPDELLSMQDPHGEAGYFVLEGVELSRAECYAIDNLAQGMFLAFRELIEGGRLPPTISELTPQQLTKLRVRALGIAASSMIDGAQGKMPLEIDGDDPGKTYSVKSHRAKTPRGQNGETENGGGGT